MKKFLIEYRMDGGWKTYKAIGSIYTPDRIELLTSPTIEDSIASHEFLLVTGDDEARIPTAGIVSYIQIRDNDPNSDFYL